MPSILLPPLLPVYPTGGIGETSASYDGYWDGSEFPELEGQNFRNSQLLEVRTDQANKIFCPVCRRQRVLFVGQHVRTNVVFENFSH
jgi:hypothetical protein